MRTPSLEFLHDLRSDALPTSGLDATLSDIARATLEFLSPGGRDLLVRFLQTGEQLFGDASPLWAREAQDLSQ